MTARVAILGPDGRALPPSRPRASMMLGGSGMAYDAASRTSQEMDAWFPGLGSPDAELNLARDTIVGRIRDVVRNDGWSAGAVTSLLDNVVGPQLRLVSTPNHRYLSLFARGCDAAWAAEFASAVETLWGVVTQDPGRWFDLSRLQNFGAMSRLAFRHMLVDGEALAMLPWRPDRMGYGRASYATCVQLIDPDRLSNPNLLFDLKFMRAGVEIDADGAAIAYHIRRAHQGDWFAAPQTMQWDRVPRETPHGRPVVVHVYTSERTAQHRGAGIFTPVLARLKMLAAYDRTELQAAVVNAIFAAYLESPFDPSLIQDAMAATDGDTALSAYQAERSAFAANRRLSLNGVAMPTLFPGEKMVFANAARPHSNFEAFEGAVLRNISAATGQSAEQVTRDYSKTNYSSARAAMLEAWKSIGRYRHEFSAGFCSPIYAAWLEEAIDRGELPMPAGAPDFAEARAAYAACRWMGPPRGWVDPVKEAQGAVLRMDAGLSTLQQECAEQGLEWEEVLAQRAREIAEMKRLGLPLPEWAVQAAQDAALKPDLAEEKQ